MSIVYRNISNKRANESLVVAQNDGTFLEKHCSTVKCESSKEMVWPTLFDWVINLQRNGKLGRIIAYCDTSSAAYHIQ